MDIFYTPVIPYKIIQNDTFGCTSHPHLKTYIFSLFIEQLHTVLDSAVKFVERIFVVLLNKTNRQRC